MYNDLVKKLLKKHFGEPRASLELGSVSPADEGKCYYLAIDNENEILAFREFLSMRRAVDGIATVPELVQHLPVNGNRHKESPQCVRFSEKEGDWVAAFYTVKEIVYHNSRGERTVATAITEKSPYITISNRADGFFGYWQKMLSHKQKHKTDREGFSYWTNKALWNNPHFRDFTADLFYEVADIEKKYILKDISRSIAAGGFFLPEVTFDSVLSYRTPDGLIKDALPEAAGLKIDFNKLDLNIGYLAAKVAGSIDRRDLRLLTGISPDELADYMSLKIFYEGLTAAEFVHRYYLKRLYEDNEYRYADMLIDDYINMCFEVGEPMRLGLDSDSMIRVHDELAAKVRAIAGEKEFGMALVKSPSKFDRLEEAIAATGSKEFERIVTTKRLFEESENQHNCVFSRRRSVRLDRASIYHWDHGLESYTVQFCVGGSGRYQVEEIKARFNKPITPEDHRFLKDLLSDFCTVGSKLLRSDHYAGAPVDPLDEFMDELPF